MSTATVAQASGRNKRRLRRDRAPLKSQCRAAGITHDEIARRAKVDRTTVVHFFSGRRSSKSVPLAIELLLGERARGSLHPANGHAKAAREAAGAR